MINPNDMKLNNLCPICKKEIFLMQDYAGKDKVLYHTDCLIIQEKQQATKELLEEVNKIMEESFYIDLKVQLSKLGEQQWTMKKQ